MEFRQKITLCLLLYIVLCPPSFAQQVEIPDPNLYAAIRAELGINAPVVTRVDILQLTGINAERSDIADLTGLEHALNLKWLILSGNRISNLDPLAGLTQLEYIALPWNEVSDISALANLLQLNRLLLDGNQISDLGPLANLTNLTFITLHVNRIRDVRPLAGLHNLEHLSLENNQILDYSPLDGLALSHFTYDQSCEMAPEPLAPRLENRAFPSVATAFTTRILNKPNLVETVNLPHLSDWGRLKLAESVWFDLYIAGEESFGQTYQQLDGEWHIRGNTDAAMQQRNDHWLFNPNMIFLREIRMWDAGPDHFPEDSPYWARDAAGNRIGGGLYLINYSHPDVQDIIVEQAIATSRCGLYDGIFIDRWREDVHTLTQYVSHDEEVAIRVSILERIRSEARPDFLIVVNANNQPVPRTGQYINGSFMETKLPFQVTNKEILERRVAYSRDTLEWLAINLREPRLPAILSGNGVPTEPLNGPINRRWMRTFTTMSLTHADGYIGFVSGSIVSGIHWHDFWDADLGQPVSPPLRFYEDIEKLYIREFTNGWAVYNQSGEAQVVTLPEEVQSVANGLVNTAHALLNFDGDIYLRTAPKEPADVNGDGVVNILDLTLVAQAMGTDKPETDVNGDGVVNVLDLVFVANRF